MLHDVDLLPRRAYRGTCIHATTSVTRSWFVPDIITLAVEQQIESCIVFQ